MNFQRWAVGSPDLVALMQHSLFQNKLKADIESGDVFPAIRSGKFDFYFRGRKLFSFDQQGFRTNAKFGVVGRLGDVLACDLGKEITEDDLADAKIEHSFETAYEAIKKNIELHKKDESRGVSELCKNFTYAKPQCEDLVILDVERSLTALSKDDDDAEDNNKKRSQDRVDLVILKQSTRQLAFIEAKCFINSELWPKNRKDPEVPQVVYQVRRYKEQLDQKGDEIVKGYGDYITIVNRLFGLSLDRPEHVLPSPGLLVFDYPTVSNKAVTDLKRTFQTKYEINVIAIGSPSRATMNTWTEKWWPTLKSGS